MIKLHGTGNTFYLLEDYQGDYSNKTIALCQDGTDGVLFAEPSETGLVKMRILNADGSEPEMCGNGLRCFARHMLEKHGMREAVIETLETSYQVRYIEDFYGMVGIEISLYPVKKIKHPELSLFNEAYQEEGQFYTVSNPHLVIEREKRIDEKVLTDIGLKGNTSFSEGVNVNVMSVLEAGKIYVQTFERGVGITKSCGTGTTSSAVHYATTRNYYNQEITIFNDGGLILCRVVKEGQDYRVFFTGNATYINKDDWDCSSDQLLYERFYHMTRELLKAYY